MHPIDDLTAVLRSSDNRLGCVGGTLKIGWIAAEAKRTRIGVDGYSGNRLLELMSQRSGELSQHAHPVQVREIRLELVQLVARLFGTLALRKVEHECYTLVPRLFEPGSANEHSHAAAVFSEQLLLERLHASDRPQLRQALSHVEVKPFGRSQVHPLYPTRGEIFTVVAHDAEKCVIRLKKSTVELRDENPDNVGVHQPPDLRFALLESTIQAAVFKRNCCGRSEDVQYGNSSGREDVGS